MKLMHLALSAAVMHTIVIAHATTARADVGSPDPGSAEATPFVNFSELKNSVVSKISAASERVWLSTDFLTDGDVVGALHLAKYRRVDVQVLLGRSKANAYMSRLGFLKNQEISTWIKPKNFMPSVQSAILSDNQLFLVDGDLDFMTNRHNFVLRIATPAQAQEFGSAFQSAVAEGLDVKPAPVPAVGRKGSSSGRGGRAYVPPTATDAPSTPKTPAKNTNTATNSPDQTYNYGRDRHSRPQGIPQKLPKALKWKEIDKIRKSQTAPDGG